MEIVTSLRPLWASYTTYVVDVWGVLYDGFRMLMPALHALEETKRQGHRVVLLSNSTRTSQELEALWEPEGLKKDLYDRFVTSGDYVRTVFQDWVLRWGNRVYVMGTSQHQASLKSAFDCQWVDHPDETDFVVFASLPDLSVNATEPYVETLKSFLKQGCPALCINPDLYSMQGSEKRLCAGSLASAYQNLGGDVVFAGKPYVPIYEYAVRDWCVDPRQVMCVGDSLRTDMAGAHAMGYSGLWILTGVHQQTGLAQPETLHQLCQDYQIAPPAYVMESFKP